MIRNKFPKTWWRVFSPSLIGVGGAFFVAVIIAVYIMQAPSNDLSDLLRFLLLSSLPSLLIGYGLFWWGQNRLQSIRLKVVLAYGLGVVIAITNIYVTSRLMFLNQHDFILLSLLLVFAGLLSVSFGFTLAMGMTQSLNGLKIGVKQLADGDLSTRVEVFYQDELADVALAFNCMADELEYAFQQLKDLEAARQNLIVAVSHDLRTPLSSVRAMVEALSDRVVTDQETVDRYHHTIQHQITNLTGLIDDFFELSKIESGKLHLRLEPGSVCDLISDTLESMRAKAVARHIALNGTADVNLPLVQMEPAKIQRVLDNLVQNALRHTPAQGRVFIAAKAVSTGVQVDVSDTGEGILETEQDQIFNEFYRGEKSRNRDTGGAGLGLAIAKGIIEAHQGEIWVNSAPERGTTFSFRLPG